MAKGNYKATWRKQARIVKAHGRFLWPNRFISRRTKHLPPEMGRRLLRRNWKEVLPYLLIPGMIMGLMAAVSKAEVETT